VGVAPAGLLTRLSRGSSDYYPVLACSIRAGAVARACA